MAISGSYVATGSGGAGEAAPYSVNFDTVEGYHIAAAMTADGFSGQFYVYVWDRVSATNKRPPFGLAGEARPRGELTLTDSERRGYTFRGIDLQSLTFGVTRRERFRLYEFKYDPEVLRDRSREESPVRLKNREKRECGRGALGDDFKYRLASAENNQGEHLLGFAARSAHEDNAVLRFSAIRNAKNSFLECAIGMHQARVRGDALPEMEIDFTQRMIRVNQDNLRLMILEESSGEMLGYRSAGLGDVAGTQLGQENALVRINSGRASGRPFGDPDPRTLLEHENSPEFGGGGSDPQTVETATISFLPPHYRDIAIS